MPLGESPGVAVGRPQTDEEGSANRRDDDPEYQHGNEELDEGEPRVVATECLQAVHGFLFTSWTVSTARPSLEDTCSQSRCAPPSVAGQVDWNCRVVAFQ